MIRTYTHSATTNVGSTFLLRKVKTGWVTPNGIKFSTFGWIRDSMVCLSLPTLKRLEQPVQKDSKPIANRSWPKREPWQKECDDRDMLRLCGATFENL